jgi:MSHA biogenesis protein MshN
VQAVKTLERSLPNAAGAPDYHALLATLQQALGQHAAAAEHFTRALARRPDEGRWWVGIGISLRAQGVGGAADEAFANALASPGLPLALRAYAENELAERAR